MLILQKEYNQHDNNANIQNNQLHHILKVVKRNLIQYHVQYQPHRNKRRRFNPFEHLRILNKLKPQKRLPQYHNSKHHKGRYRQGNQYRVLFNQTRPEKCRLTTIEQTKINKNKLTSI